MKENDGKADASAASEAKDSAEPAEDPAITELKKKLEIKDKEATEWKVGCAYFPRTLPRW